MERKTVSVRIDPIIWKEAKKYSVEKDISIGKLVESALIQVLRR